MIKQVEDIVKVSAEWKLENDERIKLYTICANALDQEGESQAAFKLYFEAFRKMSAQSQSKKKGAKTETKDLAGVERMVVNAIKAPKILNFEEILILDLVKDI